MYRKCTHIVISGSSLLKACHASNVKVFHFNEFSMDLHTATPRKRYDSDAQRFCQHPLGYMSFDLYEDASSK